MTYKEAETYLYEIPKFTSKNPVEHTKEFMRRLGNPQETFETIHVAGSNGKGSVCAMIHSALCESGRRVGLFTSPHLVNLTERFYLGREQCSKEVFMDAFAHVLTVVKQMEVEGFAHPTFFEMIFAIGMVIFREAKMEYVVLETGLGGRLDTTNVVKKPRVCVITSISLEHTEYLGDTYAAIAGEKAGIIKAEVPVVFDAKNKEVADVIFEKARQMLAPAYPVYPGDILVMDKRGGSMEFCFDLNGHTAPITVPFVADYQAENGALAMQACEILMAQGVLTFPQFVEGMKKVSWPGRMQALKPDFYVDGAHNPDGIRVFLQAADKIGMSPKTLLFGMVKEKNYEACVRQIREAKIFQTIVVTEIGGERKLPAQELASLLQEDASIQVLVESNIKDALKKIQQRREGCVFCAGSLYLAGEIIKEFEDD
ncbi:dihydrofolate synthase / folylpolyglutamate synthase [Lachnospiraceae bacterium XBB1006]|nr:dihydrofolate synthase / folylpolyglutamate synthase [Lachnospiraceae bacterium XBB1006]